ncbi:50S ribosomal protein L22 [Candidatus Peribacteria bacterium RIFCSPLOWO2_01_FULL_51_18]|nr:MAG: 50S ribosomal protein L22 [Candidatus Peribacteria bacterium RIFCSPHIGHO2_02_FULL_51_15]OGJ65603.1 MAG: 50S ribosomal protein L22 [Candidatus Peribacteria bacterium RIFCSPLOWO2_01_FULL_51_18]OGJ69253.1 MAG: 50S ribosomal protein L22 [Candidatus Peribacteria bacterium RIFCSPLOWO2_02_FULL_51_10]
MHASIRSTRLAPKKANLMAKIVRGLTVPDAIELLRKTSKKSARLFENVIRSAAANAEHNFKQDPQMMILKTVVVNQGTAYRRGIPMARGRVRPIKKFLSHISVTLGFPETEEKSPKKPKNPRSPKKKNESIIPANKIKSDISSSEKQKPSSVSSVSSS